METTAPTTTATTTIELEAVTGYSRDHYGIVAKSTQEWDFTGRGIHNRHHGHVLQVWDNTHNDNGKDPQGFATDERLSLLFSAQATVISAHPGKRVERGSVALRLGDVVELVLAGVPFGTYRVEARPLHNPHLVRI